MAYIVAGSAIATALALGIHELGHFLAASALGYQASMVFGIGSPAASAGTPQVDVYTGVAGNFSALGFAGVAVAGSLFNLALAVALPVLLRRRYADLPLGIALANLLIGLLSLLGDLPAALSQL